MKYFIDTEFLEGTQKGWFGKTTKPTIDLISVGIVCEDSREYYAISKDFNLKEAWNRFQVESDLHAVKDKPYVELYGKKVYWIRDNVLKPIYKELHRKENLHAKQALYRANVYIAETEFKFTLKNLKKLIKKYGKTNKQIAKEIKHFVANRPIEANKEQWILDYDTKDVKFYGYYSDYDWVVFCWLFGRMIDLPKGFPMYCIDLKQELDRYNQNKIYTVDIANIPTNIAIQDYINKHVIKKDVTKHPNYPKQTNEHNALADAKWNFELYKFLNKL